MPIMLIVRPADRTEVDAAIEVWKTASSESQLAGHPEHLRAWAGASGAVLFVADSGTTLIGMALSLVGRPTTAQASPSRGCGI